MLKKLVAVMISVTMFCSFSLVTLASSNGQLVKDAYSVDGFLPVTTYSSDIDYMQWLHQNLQTGRIVDITTIPQTGNDWKDPGNSYIIVHTGDMIVYPENGTYNEDNSMTIRISDNNGHYLNGGTTDYEYSYIVGYNNWWPEVWPSTDTMGEFSWWHYDDMDLAAYINELRIITGNMRTTEWKAYKTQFDDTGLDYIRLIPNN
ncbi:MAG: hypothetical protein E7300_12555 [Lachnospiraceae bacterium]|nr:hypothetical protein [Lachnospiraceae bacterium]